MQQDDSSNIAAIQKLFAEFAAGNYSYRIPVLSRKSYLDALATYLNLFADDFQSCLRDSARPVETSPGKEEPAELLSKYILLHLEEPLPTLRNLSRMFLTNERKLKETFRAMFHTSIYKYYNQERLRKAQSMILQTDEPLQVIADLCGFNTYPNFSTAFKKHYGYAPNTLRGR